ncbi:dihydroorotate dehydrogenase electron transfer subunit [Bacillus alveayuensis]|jgi:dihydroorotate dehydrogenase electron transfer subunit|uniref:Dihydroorotate dehydrogenase B (NAD(+)), electron transfer subunit n=1 Tax=Aeribacillus alveayuensis TaxID=279215 RepID=A0ABT9VL17_9BACI|nr:dihydroorotate dehydrogenase electron transfer subunit [Bacillus alveayuensis]MDQ0161666.1 dihydroorotate dehydrogenase electron transfer subunit [Bacillus alveayuensis]
MKKELMKICRHEKLAFNIFEMELEGDLVHLIEKPGQFVHIKVDDRFDVLLRRPISIAEFQKEDRKMKLIYRAEGVGTKRLSTKKAGDTLDVLGPLGNGFSIEEMNRGNKALIVGGGIGVPPLYELSKQLVRKGVFVTHVLGFQSKDVVFYEQEFEQLGKTFITTADGSYGIKGFVTDVIREEQFKFDTLYSCGPTPMLAAIEKMFPDKNVYISLEERMGCGIGACFACVCPVKEDETGLAYKKICTDGPVFRAGEVVYSC